MLWQMEMAEALSRALPAERGKVMADYAAMTGYSIARLYIIARQQGFDSGRQRRADKGSYRSEITPEQIEMAAALIHTSSRQRKGAILPVEDALEIMVDNGCIERGRISAARLGAILKERLINAEALKQQRPHTDMRSLHPNHVHLVDVSVCVQYYLRNGRTGLMDERDFYKNKPQNFEKVKLRLLRYMLTDHFSGAFFPYYFETSGETKENLYSFVTKAWAHKQDEKFPFRGVPFLILMDRGSANTSKAVVMFFRERLGIELPEGMPYNPQKQGSVEVMHNVWERHFESKLAFQPAWGVEELNSWAYDYAVWFNATRKHTRHGLPRTACWSQIKEGELRELPAQEFLAELWQEPEFSRTVDGTYTISVRGREYRLKHIEGLHSGARVMVVLKAYIEPRIEVIYKDTRYEAEPLPDRLPASLGRFRADAAIIGQEYKAQTETLTQQAVKRMENMAYGETHGKDAIPFEGLVVHGLHADKLGKLAFLDKKGTPMDVDKAIAPRFIAVTELLVRAAQQGARLTRELNQALKAEYGEVIEAAKAEEALGELLAGTWRPEAAISAQLSAIS